MSNWIKCSERLPEKGREYLCYCDGSESGYRCYYEVRYLGEFCLPPRQITHWQPLPEPPKEGE